MESAHVKPPISLDLLNQIDICAGTIQTVSDVPNSEKLVTIADLAELLTSQSSRP